MHSVQVSGATQAEATISGTSRLRARSNTFASRDKASSSTSTALGSMPARLSGMTGQQHRDGTQES